MGERAYRDYPFLSVESFDIAYDEESPRGLTLVTTKAKPNYIGEPFVQASYTVTTEVDRDGVHGPYWSNF